MTAYDILNTWRPFEKRKVGKFVYSLLSVDTHKSAHLKNLARSNGGRVMMLPMTSRYHKRGFRWGYYLMLK